MPPLPDELHNQFFASWDGFFKSCISGTYYFWIEYVGGIRIWINNIPFGDNWNCNSNIQNLYFSYFIFNGEYTSIHIEYFSPMTNRVVLKLKVKKPEDSEYFIPQADNLFHLPSTVLSYSKPRTIYYIRDKLDMNTFMLFGTTKNVSSFSISPALPNGLSLSNGIIMGVVTTTSPETEYDVKCILSDGTVYHSSVFITVRNISIPTDVHVEDKMGNRLDNITVYQFESIPTLYFKSDTVVNVWNMIPFIPQGLAFDPIQGILSGRITVKGDYYFTVSAQNQAGISSKLFYISSNGCNVGPIFYTSLSMGTAGWLILENSEEIVSQGVVYEGDYGIVLCVPVQLYLLHFNCTKAKRDCVLRIMREDGLCFFHSIVMYRNLLNARIILDEKDPPIIMVPKKDFYLAVNGNFSISFSISNSFHGLEFSPSLPSTVNFDEERLELRGYISYTGILTYSVSSYNEIGYTHLQLTFYVGLCPDQKYLIYITRAASQLGETIEIIKENETVYSCNFQTGSFREMLCLDHGEYMIRMRDTSGKGWTSGSDLVITDQNNRFLGSFILELDKAMQEEVFLFTNLVDEKSSMKYLISTLAPLPTWKSPSFQDCDWGSIIPADDVRVSAGLTTVYFRKHFTVTSDSVTFLIISVLVQEGLIVYFQGDEIGRVNLPAGTIYHSTTATNDFSEAKWLSYATMVSSNLPEVVVSAELHRKHIVSSGTVKFDIYVTYSESSSLFCTFDPVVKASNHTTQYDHLPIAAFDGNSATSWIDEGLPVWISASTSKQETFVANRVDISIGEYWNWQVPNIIYVWGIDMQGTQTKLALVNGNSLFSYSYATHSIYFQNNVSYFGYGLTISSVLSGNATLLSSVAFYLSYSSDCPSQNGWPTVHAGTTVYKDCPNLHIGKQSRKCVQKGTKGVWLEERIDGCVARYPSSGEAFVDFILEVRNCSLRLWEKQVRFIVTKVLLQTTQQHDDQLKEVLSYEKTENLFTLFVLFRFSLGAKEAESVKGRLEEVKGRLTELMNKEQNLPDGLEFSISGEIQLRRFYLYIFIVCVCIALVTLYLLYCYLYWLWNHSCVHFKVHKMDLLPTRN